MAHSEQVDGQAVGPTTARTRAHQPHAACDRRAESRHEGTAVAAGLGNPDTSAAAAAALAAGEPSGFVATSSGLLIPAASAAMSAPRAVLAEERRARVHGGRCVLVGSTFGLLLFALACGGLSPLMSIAAVVATINGYDVLASQGWLPRIDGPWRRSNATTTTTTRALPDGAAIPAADAEATRDPPGRSRRAARGVVDAQHQATLRSRP